MVKRLLFAILLLLFYSCSIAQSFEVEKFSARDGLVSDKLESIYQDHRGYLWIGTEIGISRYNGYEFEPFLFAGDKQIETIYTLTEDEHRTLWAGGERGLFYFDGHDFRSVQFAKNSPLVYKFYHDDQHNLWLCTNHGLFKILSKELEAFKDGRLEMFDLQPFLDLDKQIFCIEILPSGITFFGSMEGLHKYIPATRKLELVWEAPPRHSVKSISASSEFDILWTSHVDFPWEMKNGVAHQLDGHFFLSDLLMKCEDGYYFLTHNNILLYKDGVSKSLLPPMDPGILYVTDFIIDREGNIWITAWGGLLKYRPIPFRTMPPLDPYGEDAYSVLETRSGKMLIGGNHGMLLENQGESFHRLFSPKELFRNAELFALFEDSTERVWIGSGYEGISILENGKPVHHYTLETGLSENTIYYFSQPDRYTVWACTQNGVTEFDLRSQPPSAKVIPFSKQRNNLSELYGCFSVNGQTWFYGSQGLFVLQNEMLVGDSIHDLKKTEIDMRRVVIDKKNNIWVATQGYGLLKCRLEKNALVLLARCTVADGLQSDVVLDLLIDKNENLWLSDYRGLTLVVDPDEKPSFFTFDRHDGTPDRTFKDQRLYAQKDGTIWVYSTAGIYTFDPDHIQQNKQAPSIYMNAVRLFEGNEDVSSYQTKSDTQLPEYYFPYDKNMLTFMFSGISLSNPLKNQYQYKLEGLDDQWTTTSSRMVNYAGIPPGDYTFLVKASNNDRVWSVEPARVHFVIYPPFWKTFGFYLSSVLVVSGIVFGYVKYRIRTVRKKEEEKTRINTMMAELENKALRAQINPHFIFNSLNAIQECIVTEKTDTAYEYLTTFSRLLRMVLTYSEKNTVPLSVELTLLKHYLELESLRFNQSFHYTITCEPGLIAEKIMVPTMITQPFIENAIWHGLLHKEGNKELSIHYSNHNDTIHCVIEDNGIGRVRSEDIKRQQITYQLRESKGISLTERRIEALKALQVNVSLNIEDLVDTEGMPCGTRISIVFPRIEA